MSLFLSHLVFWRLFLNQCCLPNFQSMTAHCLNYRWNNRSILKFQISNFKFWNFKFQFLKFQISIFSETDFTDRNFAIKWFLNCLFISRRAVVYNLETHRRISDENRTFQTRFSFGKKYLMEISKRCMASWMNHRQENIMKIRL